MSEEEGLAESVSASDDAELEKEIAAAPEEEKRVFVAGMGKTTPADRQWIRDQVAEGLTKPSACALKFGISVQYVSKLLRQAKITFACRKLAREAEVAAAAASKEAEIKETFADRRLKYIEEHKLSAYAQLRSAMIIEGVRQKHWREDLASGGVGPTVKEANGAARTIVVIDEAMRRLLGIDDQIDEKELPQIDIRYMGDDEIIAARKSQQNDDEELPSLDDDVIEEES
jgi:hypothetical protein